MEIKGEYRIGASREKVFAALNDQAILQACIPGCEVAGNALPTEMTAKVRLRIGPVSAAFGGKVTLSDIDPPNGYKITGEGQGGVAGFAKGGAVVTLTEDGSDTILKYDVDAQVGGKIAQVGARLITGTAEEAGRPVLRQVRRERRRAAAGRSRLMAMPPRTAIR